MMIPDPSTTPDGSVKGAEVWKRLYLRPPAASLSKFGVSQGPPNVLDAPSPISSSKTSNNQRDILGEACSDWFGVAEMPDVCRAHRGSRWSLGLGPVPSDAKAIATDAVGLTSSTMHETRAVAEPERRWS